MNIYVQLYEFWLEILIIFHDMLPASSLIISRTSMILLYSTTIWLRLDWNIPYLNRHFIYLNHHDSEILLKLFLVLWFQYLEVPLELIFYARWFLNFFKINVLFLKIFQLFEYAIQVTLNFISYTLFKWHFNNFILILYKKNLVAWLELE